MAAEANTPLEILQKRKNEIKTVCLDKRKAKGKNRYTVVVVSCYTEIEKLLAKGDTYNGIFQYLQEKGLFDANADLSNFHRAFRLEQKRRLSSVISPPTAVGQVVVVNAKVPAVRKFTPESKNSEGVEYERDGKRFTVLKGIEREVPEGYHVLRGAIVPKLVLVEEPEDDDELIDSSKLPDYIKKSMEASMSNGTVIEDAEKHEQMVKEWKAQRKQGKHKNTKTKGVKPNET